MQASNKINNKNLAAPKPKDGPQEAPYNLMTPSGRMPEWHKLKESAAELKFREIAESTRQLSQRSRGSDSYSDQGSRRGSRASNRNILNDDSQTGDRKQLKSRQVGGERMDLVADLSANLNVNINQRNTTIIQDTDILKNKFGVSNNQGGTGRYGTNSLDARRNLKGSHTGSSGRGTNAVTGSITKQIFVNDARQQAVLPLETSNRSGAQQQNTRRNKPDEIAAKKRHDGFKSYLEQEELDKASINDLLFSATKAVQNKLNKSVPVAKQLTRHQALQNKEENNQRWAPLDERTPVSAYKDYSDFGQLTAIAGAINNSGDPDKAESITSGGQSLMEKRQGGEPPQSLHSDPVKKEGENQDDIYGAKGAGSKDVKRKQTGGVQINYKDMDLLKQLDKERPDSKSSMGRFIEDILQHDRSGQPQQGRSPPRTGGKMSTASPSTRPRGVVSKSIDVAASGPLKVNQTKTYVVTKDNVINQDSILIKHDFDAGQSKLLKTHDMTRKAQERMMQLVAMLKNKTGNGKQSSFGGASSGAGDDSTINRQRTTMPTEESPKKKQKRIITIAENEDTASDYEDKKQYFEFESPNIEGEGDIDHDGRGKNESELINQKDRQAQRPAAGRGNKTHMGFKEIENHILTSVERYGPVLGNKDAVGGFNALHSETRASRNIPNDISGKKTQDYRDKDQLGELPTRRELFGGRSMDKDDKDSMFSQSLALDGVGGTSFLDKLGGIDGGNMRIQSKLGTKTLMNKSIDATKIKALRTIVPSGVAGAAPGISSFNSGYTSLAMSNGFNMTQFRYQESTGKKKLINTELLSAVPKRGKMVDTKQYIRDNLQAYADNKYFAFTKQPGHSADFSALKKQKASAAKRNNLIVGNRQKATDSFANSTMRGNFITTSIKAASITASPQNAMNSNNASERKGTKHRRHQTLDYEPIVPETTKSHKRRVSRPFRIGKRRQQNQQNPQLYTSITTQRTSQKSSPDAGTYRLKSPTAASVLDDMAAEKAVEEAARQEAVEVNELVGENKDLRQQLADMVQVFEQYLKVASLKESAERMQREGNGDGSKGEGAGQVDGGDVPEIGSMAEGAPALKKQQSEENEADASGKLSPFKMNDAQKSMGYSSQPVIPSGANSDSENQESQYKQQSDIGHSKKNGKKQNLDGSTERSQFLAQPSEMKQSKTSSKRSISARKHNESTMTARTAAKLLNLTIQQYPENFFMNHHLPFIRENRGDLPFHHHRGETSALSATHHKTSSRHLSPMNAAAHQHQASGAGSSLRLHQVSPSGKHENPHVTLFAANRHKTHNGLLKKIDALWDEISLQKSYNEVLRVEAEIKQNNKHLKDLKLENMRENAQSLSLQVKFIGQARNKLKIPAMTKAEKKLVKIQSRIKKELERNASLNIWGLSSYIISFTIKCRVLEDLIDCAQKCQVRPDAQVERELHLMRRFQAQTWADIAYYLKEREKHPWRTWDANSYGKYKKSETVQFALGPERLENMDPKVETQVLHFWYEQLTQLEMDQVTYVQICREMVEFLNRAFGSTAWLTLARVKALRQLNMERGAKIENALEQRFNDPLKRPNLADGGLYWLNLSSAGIADNEDITVVGPAAPSQLQKIEQLKQQDEEQRKKYLPNAGDVSQRPDTTSEEGTMKILSPKLNDDVMINEAVFPPSSAGDTVSKGDTSLAMTNTQRNNAAFEYESTKWPAAVSIGGAPEADVGPASISDYNDNKLLEPVDTIQEESNSSMKDDSAAQSASGSRSNWQKTLERERKEAAIRKRQQEDARAKRLARLFNSQEDQSSDDEDSQASDEEALIANLDRGAANTKINSLLDKVDVHLKVEMNILQKWKDKDDTYGQEANGRAALGLGSGQVFSEDSTAIKKLGKKGIKFVELKKNPKKVTNAATMDPAIGSDFKIEGDQSIFIKK